jgi:hypothetical protein
MKPLVLIVHSSDGDWPLIAEGAKERLNKFCGPIEIVSISLDPKEVIRSRFVELLKLQRPVWLADADLWFIRPYKLPVIQGDVIVGALNEHGPLDEVMGGKFAGLDFKIRDTFNLSLVSLDMGSPVMRACVQKALEYLDDFFADKTPNHAEVFLNRSARDYGVMVARMSNYLNWCGNQHISPKAIAIHAAEQPNKLKWLEEGASKINA